MAIPYRHASRTVKTLPYTQHINPILLQRGQDKKSTWMMFYCIRICFHTLAHMMLWNVIGILASPCILLWLCTVMLNLALSMANKARRNCILPLWITMKSSQWRTKTLHIWKDAINSVAESFIHILFWNAVGIIASPCILIFILITVISLSGQLIWYIIHDCFLSYISRKQLLLTVFVGPGEFFGSDVQLLQDVCRRLKENGINVQYHIFVSEENMPTAECTSEICKSPKTIYRFAKNKQRVEILFCIHMSDIESDVQAAKDLSGYSKHGSLEHGAPILVVFHYEPYDYTSAGSAKGRLDHSDFLFIEDAYYWYPEGLYACDDNERAVRNITKCLTCITDGEIPLLDTSSLFHKGKLHH